MKKNLLQLIKDFVFFPIRIFFNHETVRKLGLTSLQNERFNVCLPYVRGKVLDIGCGKGNKFIKKIGQGIGMDPYFSKNVDIIAKAEDMPFVDKEFQTITMMGTLRYIDNMQKAMQEINRVLKDDGLVLILENHPFLNNIRHALIWWNPYKRMERINGLRKKDILNLTKINGFKIKKIVRYVYGLSVMYILIKDN